MIKRLFIWTGAFAIAIILAPFVLFPSLAITEPSGSDLVVVEGWIPQERIPAVVQALEEHHYSRIYTTGTVREATYYLQNGDTLDFIFGDPLTGRVKANIAGLDGAWCVILADEDTLMNVAATARNIEHFANLAHPTSRLRVVSTNFGRVEANISNIYLKHLLVANRNVHEMQRTVIVHHADGRTSKGRPNHAEALAAYLGNAGVDTTRIITLPTQLIEGGRTWSNATGFAARAHTDGIERVDVLSMGVHARRSHYLYQKACGSGVNVGVISIADPLCGRSNWWKHRNGWSTVMKELAGLPAVYFIGKDR